jgi:opacity protein-like surface antigen
MIALRQLRRGSILLLLWVSPLLAQELRSGAIPAAKGPEYDVGIGYSQLTMNLSGHPTVNLTGAETSATMYSNRRWGATLDSSYVRGARDAGSRHGSYVFSALTGPVFVPAQNDNTRLLIRALAGVSLVDTSVPVGQLYYRGWLSRFSWAVGMGLERNLSGPFTARLNVDYLRTRFMSTTATIQPQNDIRLSGMLVFRFAGGPKTRR